MLLMIDNYDSFTYNLVQYFGELGQDVRVHRNDEITVEDIEHLQPDHIVVS
ncbi:MAG: anthranilate/aminodeoxychorismate synthase component II, partial [Betaproteobacteria bacterium]|nr:anthranilate/aminodeoxychorismate synthase component II [Betaproteobacteria bacterium]